MKPNEITAQSPNLDIGDSDELFLIVLRTLPDHIPWRIRLRRLLKYALRACRLRVVTCRQIDRALLEDLSA